MKTKFFHSDSSAWEEKVTLHFSKQAADYSRNSRARPWRWIRSRERICVERLLELNSSHSVLEVGCGAGFYSAWLAAAAGEFIAIDACREMVHECQRLGITAECSDLENWDSSRRFQRILAAGVMEFARDPGTFLRAAECRLEPGGRLVLLVPHAGWRGWIYSCWHEFSGCPARAIPLLELQNVAENAGLRIESVESAGPISLGISMVRSRGGDLAFP